MLRFGFRQRDMLPLFHIVFQCPSRLWAARVFCDIVQGEEKLPFGLMFGIGVFALQSKGGNALGVHHLHNELTSAD